MLNRIKRFLGLEKPETTNHGLPLIIAPPRKYTATVCKSPPAKDDCDHEIIHPVMQIGKVFYESVFCIKCYKVFYEKVQGPTTNEHDEKDNHDKQD